MTMPSSGPISLGQANTELGRSATATLTMNDSALRTLAGVGGSGTTWGMNSLYGKSARTFSLASLTSISGTAFEGGFAYAEYVFYADGTTGYFSSEGSGSFGNWTTPTTSGIGSSYWIKFTETGSAGAATETGSGRGIWNQLNVAQYFGLSRTLNGGAYRTYTIQIASDSSGSNIVATTTDMSINVEIIF